MRSLSMSVAVTLVACIVPGCSTSEKSAVTPPDSLHVFEDDFVPLFNGKNLDGWTVVGDPKGFTVRNGILRSDIPYVGQWLRTNRMYGDFILKLEWRVSKEGNAGVFIRAKEQGYPWITGSEIQISNEQRDLAHCTGSL